MYGEKRLGVIKENKFLMKKPTQNGIATPVIVTASKPPVKTSIYPLGKKHYETTDWLGNVRVTYTDKKSWQQNKFALNVSSSQDYYPFGAVMEGRNLEITNYRFGFQGQEGDDEVFGKNNLWAYKYRLHDARLGRFFSVDPLEKNFPWNSSYGFSENCVISCIELEGAERYYSANGDYLGKMGKSNEIRVVPQTEVKNFIKFKDLNHTKSNPPVFDKSVLFHQASQQAQVNIVAQIYKKEINPEGLDKISIDYRNDGKGMSMTLGGAHLTVFPNVTKEGEYILDDYYNMVNLLFHEEHHRKGTPDDGWNHFSIAIAQTQHKSFSKMTEAGKKYLKSVMRGYLNEDMEGWMNRQIFFAGSRERAMKIFNSREFQYAYKTYMKNVDYYNNLFGENYKKIDYQEMINKVYEKKNNN
ncbi:MAG: hypothetical protein KatS3mg035_2053 [Bacteroidia bacterium]|nr:MAG: hypothetical protein KatS3mg035_2053 [Bacteroidia bacterium]